MAILMQDTFTNANGTVLSNHTSDSGHRWAGATSAFDIQNNVVNTVTSRQWSDFDTGNANLSYSIVFDCTGNTGSYLRVRFRCTDDSNYFWVVWMGSETWDLRKQQGGTGITIGSTTVTGGLPSSLNSYRVTVKVVCNGDTIEVYIAGTLAFSHTDSFNNTATRLGFYGYNTGHRFDDVLIESLGTTEPEPIGEEGSTAFDLRQSLYSDALFNADMRQSIYSDGTLSYDLAQRIYADMATSFDTRFISYQDSAQSYDTNQAIYEASAVHMDTRQVIYEVASTAFDMLQEYYQDGMTGSTPFDIRIQLYEDSTTLFDSRQEWYSEGFTVHDLQQAIYEAGKLDGDVRLILYADSALQADTAQFIYSDDLTHFDTKQVLYDTDNQIIGVIHLKGERKLYIELQGKRELYIPLKGGVSMTVNNPTITMYQGESKYFPVTVTDVADLTGCTFEWTMFPRNGDTVLTKDSTSGISIVDGKAQIKLDPADTELLRGDYHHQCEMVDSLGHHSVISTGLITIKKSQT